MIAVMDVDLKIIFNLLQHNGRPVVTVAISSISINWDLKQICTLMDYIKRIFQGQIRDMIIARLNKILPSTFANMIQQNLDKLELKFIMNNYMGGDYSLTSDAIYLTNLLRISTLAGIFEKNSSVYGPYSTTSVPTLTATKPVSVSISESVLDNVVWVYFRANKIRADNQSSSVGYNFTIYANTPPSITINETGIYTFFNGTLDGYFETNGTLAFSIIFLAGFNIELYVTTQGNIIVQIPELRIDNMQLSYSFFVRRITEEQFLNWLKSVLNKQIPELINRVNLYLKANAIDLPSIQGINWENVTIRRQMSWIIFESDLTVI